MATKPASIGGWGYIGSFLASQVPPAPQNALQIMFLDNGTGVPPYGGYQYSDGLNWVNFGSGGGAGTWGSITGSIGTQADLQAQFTLKAALSSPTFSGVPAAPTAAPGTNTTQIATMAAIVAERTATGTITGKTMSGASNTFSGLPASGIVGVIPIANLATGTPTGSKFIRDDGTLQAIAGGGDALVANPLSQFAATTSAQLAGVLSDETGSAGGGFLVFSISPALTGTPTAPTASVGTNTTQLATMAAIINERAGSATLTNKTLTAPVIATIVNTGTLTLPTATDTLVGRATTDTLTNKTLTAPVIATIVNTGTLTLPTSTDTLVGRATTDTLSNKTLFSPIISGTGTGTVTFPASYTMVATPSPADNSFKIATTGYVDAGLALKVTINAPANLTGANTLTQASHFNRALSWTGSTTAAQAVSATATSGDYVEFHNDGTAAVTFTGVTAGPGYKLDAQPGELFQASYTAGVWTSNTPVSGYMSPINSQSAAYGIVAADVGKTIYHPSADTTGRTLTIPANATIPIPIGSVITIDNDFGAGNLIIAITSDTLVLVGAAGSTGSRTLSGGGRAVLQKVTATRWRISGSAELT